MSEDIPTGRLRKRLILYLTLTVLSVLAIGAVAEYLYAAGEANELYAVPMGLGAFALGLKMSWAGTLP